MNTDHASDSNTPKSAGRVVLCNIGRAGDTILRNSILDSVYRTYAEVTYICGRGNVDLIRSDPRHRTVLLFRNSPAGFLRVLRRAWFSRHDAYIDLKDHDSSVSLMLARLFRADAKTGVNRPNNRPFDRDTRAANRPGDHKVEIMRRIACIARLRLGQFRPSVVCPPDSTSWFQKVFPAPVPFHLLNVSATHPNRMWQAEKWIEYLCSIDRPAVPLLVNAVPADRGVVERICATVPLARRIEPRQFMDVVAAVARAKLVITVNTGVLHICSALDVPVVVLANGPAEIREFAPLSSRQLIIQADSPRVLADLSASEAISSTTGRLPI